MKIQIYQKFLDDYLSYLRIIILQLLDSGFHSVKNV